MLPSFLFNYLPNMFMGNTVNSSKNTALPAPIKKSYFSNIFIRKTRVMAFFSPTFTAFFNHIIRVVLGCSYKKMGYSNARTIVTFMTNEHSFGNLSFFHFPMKAMRNCLFIMRGIKNSVTSGSFCAHPHPTSFSFLDVFEEAFGKIFTHGKLILSRAIPLDVKASEGFCTGGL